MSKAYYKENIMGANENFVFQNVRILYPNVVKPGKNYAGDGDEYSLVILIPKTDTQQAGRLQATYQRLATIEFKTIPGNLRPFLGTSAQKAVLKDGDEYYNYAEAEKKAMREPYVGHYYLTVKIPVDRGRIDAVDANQNPIISADQIPSGSYGHVVCECSAYKSPKFGPNFSITPRLVQVTDISKPLGPARMDVETACSLLPGGVTPQVPVDDNCLGIPAAGPTMANTVPLATPAAPNQPEPLSTTVVPANPVPNPIPDPANDIL
jgi:hypothetical protein